MITLEELTKFNEQESEHSFDGHPRAIRVSKNYVAKAIFHPQEYKQISERKIVMREALRELERRYEVWQRAYTKGLSVPRPKGLFLTQTEELEIPALVVNFIPGQDLYQLEEAHKRGEVNELILSKAYELEKLEVKKAQELGFYVSDNRPVNAVWNPENKKIYLIDLDEWSIMADTKENERVARFLRLRAKLMDISRRRKQETQTNDSTV